MSGMRGIIDAATAVKPGLYPTFELWCVAANAALLQGYGIDYPGAGADEDDLRRWYEDHLQHGETVEDCARAFAEDYDLYEPDPITAQDLKRTHPIPPPPAAPLAEEGESVGEPNASHEAFLTAAYSALNEVPRTLLNGQFPDSYRLAAQVHRYLKMGDHSVSLEDLLKACKQFLNTARNTRLYDGYKDTYALAHAFDLAGI